MNKVMWCVCAMALSIGSAQAGPLDDLGRQAATVAKDEGAKAAKSELNKVVVEKVNKKLLAEGRKNQCSFKSDSDELEKGCGQKAQRLANALIDAKKALQTAGYSGFKFVVSGHTDTRGDAAHNKELSEKRAAVMVRELKAKGIDGGEIEAVGMGSERPLVQPDDTKTKQAKNRRYEVQVKI